MGFSLNDQHIRQIILRAADSNPTLKVVYFCHSETTVEKVTPLLKPGERRYKNIELIVPSDDIERFDLKSISSYLHSAVSGTEKEDVLDD